MIEFVMVMPFLGFILALIFFFGFAMKNQQRVKAAARYQSWYRVNHATGERIDNRHPTLNEMFFYDKASSWGSGGGVGPIDSLEELTEATSEYREKTYDLAHDLLMSHASKGSHATASGRFPSGVDLWDNFHGSIRSEHTRDGHEWRHGHLNYLQPVRDNFLEELDEHIETIDHEQLRQNIQRLYLKRW